MTREQHSGAAPQKVLPKSISSVMTACLIGPVGRCVAPAARQTASSRIGGVSPNRRKFRYGLRPARHFQRKPLQHQKERFATLIHSSIHDTLLSSLVKIQRAPVVKFKRARTRSLFPVLILCFPCELASSSVFYLHIDGFLAIDTVG